MRRKALLLLLLAAALATPAAAGHWHGRGSFRLGVGINAGPGWWGGGWGGGLGVGWWGPGWWSWGAPLAWYEPAATAPPRTDLTQVDIEVEPEHARVLLNGQLIGVADDFDASGGYLYLKPGRYTLEFALRGYRSVTMTVDSNPGRFVPIKLTLARVPGETAAPWYERPKGLPVSHVFGPPLPAPPPSTASAAGPGAASNGAEAGVRSGLRAQPDSAPVVSANGGALALRVAPPNAAVYVDGRLVGTAAELAQLERGLAVAAGPHTVEVAAPGLTSRSVRVNVTEGQRQEVVVDLGQGAGQN